MRLLLVLALVATTATADAAGWRRNRSYSYCNTAYCATPTYYPQQSYQRKSVAEVLGAISEQKQAYDALTTGLDIIFPQQAGAYGSNGYASATVNETYGPQGNTTHAYQNLQHGGFGTLDAAAGLDMASRYANNALQVGAQAGQDLNGIVQTGVDGQVRVAEVLARGQVAVAALNAAAGQPAQPLTRTIQLNVQQDASGNWTAQPAGAPTAAMPAGPGPQADPRLAFLQVAQQSANQSCVKCHQGPEAKGGLDLTNLTKLSDDDWNATGGIIDRLTTTDPNQLMPRGGDGKGHRLGNGVIRWWMGAAPDQPEAAPDGS